MDLLTQLSKTSTKPFEKIVRVFITIAAFAAIFISVAIVIIVASVNSFILLLIILGVSNVYSISGPFI